MANNINSCPYLFCFLLFEATLAHIEFRVMKLLCRSYYIGPLLVAGGQILLS